MRNRSQNRIFQGCAVLIAVFYSAGVSGAASLYWDNGEPSNNDWNNGNNWDVHTPYVGDVAYIDASYGGDNAGLCTVANASQAATRVYVSYQGGTSESSGTLEINNNQSLTISGSLFVGYDGAGRATGIVNQINGDVLLTGSTEIGFSNRADGVYNLQSGTHQTRDLYIGYHVGTVPQAHGTYNVQGAATLTVKNAVYLGDDAGQSTGVLHVTSSGALISFGDYIQRETGTLDFTAEAGWFSTITVAANVGNGAITLDGNLVVDLSAYAGVASEIILIDNDGIDAISGSFASVSISNPDYSLTYTGGDGNDLSLVYVGIPVTYYVSAVSGNDTTGDGSFAQPYKTISRAVSVAQPRDTCLVRGGIYREQVTVPINNLTLKGYELERPVISGCDVVSNGWTRAALSHATGVYQTPFPEKATQLFVNSERMNLARFPNEDAGQNMLTYDEWAETTSVSLSQVGWGTGRVVFAESASLPNDGPDSWVGGYYIGRNGPNPFSAATGRIYASTNEAIYTEDLNFYWRRTADATSCVGPGVGYIINTLRGLDSETEWYWDVDTETLYLVPKSGADLNTSVVEARTRLWGMDLSGRTGVVVEGLVFMAASVKMEESQHCKLLACRVQHPAPFTGYQYEEGQDYGGMTDGSTGVFVSGADNLVDQCHISDSWGSGIRLEGQDNTIQRCLIENVDWLGRRMHGIQAFGLRNHVLSNTVLNCAQAGIDGGNRTIGKKYGTQLNVQYNWVQDIGWINTDCGAFYINVQGQSAEGATIAYNVFKDHHQTLFSSMIYIDNQTDDVSIHHNVIDSGNARGGIKLSGDHIDVYNNTIFGGHTVAVFDCGDVSDRFVSIRNNLTDTPNVIKLPDGASNNYLIPASSVNNAFVDFAGGDYRLRQNYTAAIDAGVIYSPITDGFYGSAPDIGAFEYGRPRGSAGIGNLQVPPNVLPDAEAQVAYLASLQSQGGIPPYEWSYVSGAALPPGLTLENTGEITGTPSSSTSYRSRFTVQVVDGIGGVAQGTVVLYVNGSNNLGFDDWLSLELSPDAAASAATLDDPDNDGLNHLLEYAGGTDPVVPNSISSMGSISVASGVMQLTYSRRSGGVPLPDYLYNVSDLTYRIAVSSNLVTGFWALEPENAIDETVVALANGIESSTLSFDTTKTNATSFFARVEVLHSNTYTDSGTNLLNGFFDAYLNASNAVGLDALSPVSWVPITSQPAPTVYNTGGHSGAVYIQTTGDNGGRGIFQVVKTVPDREYELSFWMLALGNGNQCDVDVFDGVAGTDGMYDGDLLHVDCDYDPSSWQQYSYRFKARTRLTTIRLREGGDVGDSISKAIRLDTIELEIQ